MAKKANEMTSVRKARHGGLLTAIFTVLSLLWISPLFVVILNSFKRKAYIFRNPFGISTSSITEGWDKFVKGAQKMPSIRQISFMHSDIHCSSRWCP